MGRPMAHTLVNGGREQHLLCEYSLELKVLLGMCSSHWAQIVTSRQCPADVTIATSHRIKCLLHSGQKDARLC